MRRSRKYKTKRRRVSGRSRMRNRTRRHGRFFRRRSRNRSRRVRRSRRSRRNPVYRAIATGKYSKRKKGVKVKSLHHIGGGGWRNPRGRRRKSRISRRRARNTGRRYGRRYGRRSMRRNPALSLRRPMAAMFAGFDPKMLTTSALAVSGAVGNAWLSGAVSAYLPSMLKTGPGSYVVGLVTSGLLGGAVSTVAPKYAPSVFLGSLMGVAMRAYDQYVSPMFHGMGDYLTRGDAASAQSLGDYLSRGDAMSAQSLGDYLSRGDAMSAQALGGYYGGDQYISEELASV